MSDDVRDERGRFKPGHQYKIPRALITGRPRTEAAEKLRAALHGVVTDNGTMTEWRKAMKRKLAHGDEFATKFIFERISGKVPDILAAGLLDGDGAEWLKQMIGVDISEPENVADAGADEA